jgi:heme exporter protein C
MKGNEWLKTAGLTVALLLFLFAMYLIFIVVETAAPEQGGNIQRILYLHVPIAWLGMLGYTLVFIGSIAYLWKRKAGWDNFASSSAELGFIFTTLFLISGSLWAKPAWGIWWEWSPRLTTGLILWFIYVAYFMVRFYASEKQQGARFGAVVGIVGFVDVPIVALAATMRRSLHPDRLIFQGGVSELSGGTLTLMLSIAAFTVFFFYLLAIRTSLKQQETDLARLREQIEETPGLIGGNE